MTTESDAKEASILGLLDSYPSYRPTDTFIDGLLRTLEPYSVRAVALACQRFADGAVPGHNNSYMFNGPELAEQARLFHEMFERVTVPLYSGIIEMDFGHGRVDMRGLTVGEQDETMRRHGIAPDGRNMALLSLDEKREALKQEAIGAEVRPRLRKMTDG